MAFVSILFIHMLIDSLLYAPLYKLISEGERFSLPRGIALPMMYLIKNNPSYKFYLFPVISVCCSSLML